MTAGVVTQRRSTSSTQAGDQNSSLIEDAKSGSEKTAAAAAAAPDGGWGWVVVLSSFLIHIVIDGITYAFGVIFKALLHDFHSGKGETAWILSIFVGLTLGAGPLASALVNKYNCRIVTMVGGIVGAVGFLISPFAPGLWFLYISLGLVAGIGFGLIYMPAIVIVGYYFERRRALAIGIAVAGSGFGTFLFAPFIEFLVEEYGWKQTCILLSGIILNCVLFGALFRPLPIEMHKKTAPTKSPKGKSKKQQEPAASSQRTSAKATTSAATVSAVGLTAPLGGDQRDFNEFPNSQQKLLANSSVSMVGSNEVVQVSSHTEHVHPPLHKKDALYGGSLRNIPLYVSNHDLYVACNVSTSSVVLTPEKTSCCSSCSSDLGSAFRGMLDLGLLKDASFVMFMISNFFTNFGFNAPFLYVPDRATEEGGLSEFDAAFLLSIMGIANTAGRVLFGFLADIPRIKPYRLHVYNTGLVIAGLATALSALSQVYWASVVYCTVFGVFIGCYVSLTSVILVDLLGLDRLTSSFGMTLLVQGVAVVIGPPACGEIRDVTNSYTWPFIVLGLSIGVSGAMLYFIPCLPRDASTVAGRDEQHDAEMGKVLGIHDHQRHSHEASLVTMPLDGRNAITDEATK